MPELRFATHILKDPALLSTACARRLIDLGHEAISRQGRYLLALSGGETPRLLYDRLTQPDFARALDWSKVEFFFGDERTVPPDHPDSNFLLAQRHLFQPLGIEEGQIHRMAGEQEPRKAAAEYAGELQGLLPIEEGWPRFDTVLLGVGQDGHTASLFPETEVLQEREATVAAVFIPKLDTWRITLTLPTLNAARHALVMVSGVKKADIVRHLLIGSPGAAPLPVQLVRPAETLEWYLDSDAASLLQGSSS